jgi:dTDP-4-amino-4,6-dideoxygalactose transaminase
MRVPFVDLAAEFEEIGAEALAAVTDVARRGSFILGPVVERFETAFARASGAAHCVGISNGTDALALTLEAVGVGPGDEVVLPTNTFAATALAVRQTGARPRFVDCDPRTYLMDVDQALAAAGPRTRAFLPVHLYGRLLDVSRLVATGIPVVEDAAQAHGARQGELRAGTMGVAGCFSFYPSKNLGAWGDAGAVVTSDARVRDKLLRLRNYGQSQKYHHDEPGTNARLDALQAAVLEVKLGRLDLWNDLRRRAADGYARRLRPDVVRPDPEGIFHLYVIRVGNRDEVRDALGRHDIESGIHYPVPLHLQKCFADLGHRAGEFPAAERAAREILSLPMYPRIRDEQLDRVADAVNEVAVPSLTVTEPA